MSETRCNNLQHTKTATVENNNLQQRDAFWSRHSYLEEVLCVVRTTPKNQPWADASENAWQPIWQEKKDSTAQATVMDAERTKQ